MDNLVIDTTRRERFQIFEVVASIRKHLTAMLFFSGGLSTVLFTQLLMGIQVLAPPLNIIALAAMGILGVVNIICGLLLLGLE